MLHNKVFLCPETSVDQKKNEDGDCASVVGIVALLIGGEGTSK